MLGTDSNSNNSPPLSPRQPWGHSGIQKTNFAWKSAFGDFMFDTTDESMEPFNVFHNDRILITKGVWGGRKATVLGVSNGVVWLQIDDEEFVKDLKGCFTGDDLEAKFGLQVLEDDPDDAVWPESPRHPKLTFVAAIDDAHRKAFEYEGPMGTYTFNCTREATERYGFHHGQRVRATKGAYRSRCATVIGVHNGALWVHIDGDNGASPCHFCNDKADLEAKYGYKVITATATPTGMVRPPAYDKVEYPGPFGLKYSFERGEETLKRYSVTHGQTLQIGRGTDNGKKTVVIGVQTGVLWWHIQGDRAATPCQFCENFEDLQERYEVITTHEPLMMVEPNLSVWEGEPTDADQRRRERDEIESENIDDMPWDETHQPQTYRYLRAYARWRLPKNTPPGQAFMLYYVKDTAPRTSEALDNLKNVRKYWAKQGRLGVAGFDVPFQNASEKEMLQCLRQIPLSAMKIISAA